jgi:hypothetical protein
MTTSPDEQRRDAPVAGDIPNEAEAAEAFPHARNVPLREQTDLIDEHGTDIRQYTGEPVETEDGTVVPQQMAVGSQQLVGGGEFPPAPPRGSEDPSGGSDPDADGRSVDR